MKEEMGKYVNDSVKEISRREMLKYDFVVNQMNKQINCSFDVLENSGRKGVEGVNGVSQTLIEDVVE